MRCRVIGISSSIMVAVISAGASVPTSMPSPDAGQAGSMSLSVCNLPPELLPDGGGVVVRRCGNNGTVGGVGSNIDAATINANGLLAVAEQGVVCNVWSRDPYVSIPAPAVGIKADCRGASVSAFGMTTTTAGENMLELAINLAATGVKCSVNYYYASKHGFRFPYTCDRVGARWTVSGLGSNIDDSNDIAMRLAIKSSKGAYSGDCQFQDAELNGVVFKATLLCNGKRYQGYGSTVTAAANDAAVQAGA